MIEKIIVQDSSEVHSVWIPERKSLASFVVWKAFGLGSHGRWADGQISLGVDPEWVDLAFMPEFPGYQDDDVFGDAVMEAIKRVDAALPPKGKIAAALDPDSATIMPDPPAFRIPSLPYAQDVAACLLAARMLLAVREQLVIPADMTIEELTSEIDYASKIAAWTADEVGLHFAMETASSPELCRILPRAMGSSDLILQERSDD